MCPLQKNHHCTVPIVITKRVCSLTILVLVTLIRIISIISQVFNDNILLLVVEQTVFHSLWMTEKRSNV